MDIETDGWRAPVGHTSSGLLPFRDRSFAVDEEEVELAHDAVCGHPSLESVGVVEVHQQLRLLAAGRCRDLFRVPHLWGRSDSGRL